METPKLIPILSGNQGAQIWISAEKIESSLNLLVTVSNSLGEQSIYIGGGKRVATKAKYFVATPPERVITAKDIGKKRIKRVLTSGGYLLAIALLCFSSLSFLGIIKARIVLTGSMVPTINPGDIIITENPKQVKPHIGSIVAYTARRFDGTPVGVFSHRIIGGDITSGFIVKGDNNPLPDVQRPKLPDISGVVVYVIPWVGKIATPKTLFVLIPTCVGVWMVIEAVKEKDEEEGVVA